MRRRLLNCTVLMALLVAGCSGDAASGPPETSVEMVSTSPTLVDPTHADAPEGAGELTVEDWCERLAEAAESGENDLEIYREGRSLPMPALAAAAGLLISGDGSERQVLRASRLVRQECRTEGVRISGE
jgi:hypothetical protein